MMTWRQTLSVGKTPNMFYYSFSLFVSVCAFVCKRHLTISCRLHGPLLLNTSVFLKTKEGPLLTTIQLWKAGNLTLITRLFSLVHGPYSKFVSSNFPNNLHTWKIYFSIMFYQFPVFYFIFKLFSNVYFLQREHVCEEQGRVGGGGGSGQGI